MTEFRVGDVVRLRCGGPTMVAYDSWGEGDGLRLVLQWIDQAGVPHTSMAAPVALELVKASEPGGPREVYAQIRNLCDEVLPQRGLGDNMLAKTIIAMLKERGL
jgi:uncharacterized protein YodC (DUF2158 family)